MISILVETVLSVTLVYLVFSIVVSGIQEWVAQYTGRRGAYLQLGIQRLLLDEGLYARVILHPLVSGVYREAGAKGKPPSYLDPRNFAMALVNVLVRRSAGEEVKAGGNNAQAQAAADATDLTLNSLRLALKALAAQRSPVSNALMPIVDGARDLAEALKGIEDWYSSAMDRVSGWYKARTQKVLFGLGLVLAIIFDVDSIELVQRLQRSPDLRASMVMVAEKTGRSGMLGDVDLTKLRDRPPTKEEWQSILGSALEFDKAKNVVVPAVGCLSSVGNFIQGKSAVTVPAEGTGCVEELWARVFPPNFLKVLGWVLTALAGVFGAPFWFAALNKLVNLRGSGPKPAGETATAK